MKQFSLSTWMKIPFLNLLIVSFIGIILRYKIAFALPFVDQKFLLHAHSHFAFSGWLSQLLMAFIVQYLQSKKRDLDLRKYNALLWINLISAYGMLFSFPFEGYAAVSISFSTLSVFDAYVFAFVVWRDLNKLPLKSISHYWFKAALVFNAVSSLGAFALGYMMANKIASQEWYLAAVYFFLHFQYNGWFFFTAMGLLIQWLIDRDIAVNTNSSKKMFWLFFAASIPAYLLSVLWLPMPLWLYVLVVASGAAQIIGFIMLIKHIKQHATDITNIISNPVKWLWILSCIALGIKLLLQAGSTIPSLNMVAYGFRPIVIGYLHLVLLGVLSIFLIGYFLTITKIEYLSILKKGLILFVSGIIINEILLMLQGVNGIMYNNIAYINYFLLSAAVIMFLGLAFINRYIWK
ncbi:hypothetical protein FRZ67_00080 [Panacibacter ginsenosidivorans]|uniref:NnrS family protein n=1 Tax=Panacibacter ginsenosidivorans TaxID=1813871 RepID=A0A5B8V3P0_9BACT|nr:hypothetical protein [Panacibacter ginsenosidivorans]QEC65778.1 hypothetical protein FRZ67_00080 [Panacibacter ginsenosidivorans]